VDSGGSGEVGLDRILVDVDVVGLEVGGSQEMVEE
jgi:hypothetical protein